MVRKVNIINSLRTMGYSILEDSGIYVISLHTRKGPIFMTHVSDEELELGDFIVERIVADINKLILRYFQGDVS